MSVLAYTTYASKQFVSLKKNKNKREPTITEHEELEDNDSNYGFLTGGQTARAIAGVGATVLL